MCIRDRSLAGDTVAVSTTDFAMSQKDCEFIAKIQGVIAEQLADAVSYTHLYVQAD